MKRIALIEVLAGLATWPATVQGDRVTRGTVIQSTDAVASGRGLLLVHSVRRTDTLLPPYLVRLEIRFPPGTRVAGGGLPSCGLAALQAKGLDACPRRGRVGSASFTGRSILDPNVGSRVTMFKGEPIAKLPTVLMYVRPEKGSTFVAVAKLSGSRRTGVLIDLAFPTLKILAGTGPDVVISDLAMRFDRSFIRAPCPARYRVTSHFFDGEPSLSSSDRALPLRAMPAAPRGRPAGG